MILTGVIDACKYTPKMVLELNYITESKLSNLS